MITSLLNTINTAIRFIADGIRTFVNIVLNIINWIEYTISLITYIIPDEILIFIMIAIILAVLIWLIGRN